MSIEEREDGLGQMGALPEDRIEPRQIAPTEATSAPEGQGVPVDIRRQEGVEAIPTKPERLMSQGASVRSVYDARPINARDFVDTQFREIDIPFSDPGIIQVNFNFFVPGGYIAVLRGFHYELEEPVLTANRNSVRCSILVNDIIQIGYDNLLLGQVNGDGMYYTPTFILAPLGGKLTLRLLLTGQDFVDGGAGSDFPIYSEMYGNLLLSQGVPLPFEIGNLTGINPLGGT